MRPLALCWLSALYIALCRLPLALVWLPTTRFFITRVPNLVTRLDVELHPLHRLPALAPSPTYSPALAPYRLPTSGSTSRVPIKIFLRTKHLFVFQTSYASKRLLVHKELT